MKAPRTNTGISVLKDREHIRQGSPNLSRRVSILGNITDIKYPGSNQTSSGIQVLIRFEDGSSPIHWFTLAEDYALCIAVLGNRDAVIQLQPRVIYTYHPTSFFSGIAKLTTDKTQETSFLGYLENLSNAAIGFFGGILAGLNGAPGQDTPPFTPVAPTTTAPSAASTTPTGPTFGPELPSPVKPVVADVNFSSADTVPESTTGLAPGETPTPEITSVTPLGPEPPPLPTDLNLSPKERLDYAMAIPERKAELEAIIKNIPPWLTIGQDASFTVSTLDGKSIVIPVKYITIENMNKWINDPTTRGQYTEVTTP